MIGQPLPLLPQPGGEQTRHRNVLRTRIGVARRVGVNDHDLAGP